MKLATFSKCLRRVHLYLGLFLVPWMIVYALSTLGMNHWPLVRSWYGGQPVSFEKEKEITYTGSMDRAASEKEVARRILQDLDLDGPFTVQGSLKQGRLVILRQAALTPRRITYWPGEQRLLIERQTFRVPSFVNRMHTRHGYAQPYAAADVWAFTVDLVVVAMILWVLSGLWMWWESKPTRAFGLICLAFGLGWFVIFLCVL